MNSATTSKETIKVFISYSRADKGFADDLVLGLAACGFAPYIDREDIAAGEDWEQRLSGLIAEADSIVYVISPDSVASQHCSWELAESLRLAKRILPVVWRPVEDAATPADLRRLNYIFFTGESRTFAAGLSDLAAALRVDIAWIRDHTRLAGLAQRWEARGRSTALLLRGEELDAALAWVKERGATAPVITDAQHDFIKAASDARVEAERRAARAKAGLLTAVSLAAVIFAGLAGAAAWQWRDAETARGAAETALSDLELATSEVRSASLRLNANIGLRTAPADDGYFVIDPGWYPVAANFSGAVARVTWSGGGLPTTTSSGMVIAGELAHPRHAGEALLLTPRTARGGGAFGAPPPDMAPPPGIPSDTLAPDTPSQPQRMISSEPPLEGEETVAITFPVIDATTEIRATEVIWATPDWMGGVYPFQLRRLSAPLPFGARAIARDDIDCTEFDAFPPAGVIGHFGIAAPIQQAPTSGDVTLNISQLIDATDPYQMRYTHATNIAASGGPVFDLSAQRVFAIHIGSEPDPDRRGRRRGYGTSLRLIVDMMRQDMADAEAPMGPVCES